MILMNEAKQTNKAQSKGSKAGLTTCVAEPNNKHQMYPSYLCVCLSHEAHHLTNQWCSGYVLGYIPKVVPCSQSDVVGCACLQSLHIHHISLSSDIASSEGRALCADLGSEHKGGVTGVFQEHSNTSTAPSGGLIVIIRSQCHWLHGDVGRDCRGEGQGGEAGEGELMKHFLSTNT